MNWLKAVFHNVCLSCGAKKGCAVDKVVTSPQEGAGTFPISLFYDNSAASEQGETMDGISNGMRLVC